MKEERKRDSPEAITAVAGAWRTLRGVEEMNGDVICTKSTTNTQN